ncbi:MAG: hypothetical protein U0230_12545 [Polyangiales bacterium]
MRGSRKGWLLLWVWVSACGGASPAASPGDTLRAYREAVERGDAAAVHRLLSADTRDEVPVEAVAAALEGSGPELEREARQMEAAVALGLEESAEVPLEGGLPVELVREPEGGPEGPFAIDGGAFELVSLATPEQTVRALREALSRGDLRLFLAVLSSSSRTALETERARLLEETSEPADLEVEIEGDRATVRLTGGRTLPLVREGSTWRVMDLP